MYNENDKCPQCDHRWAAHRGRQSNSTCHQNVYGQGCQCQTRNPQQVAEDKQAGAMWRMVTGR